MYIHRTTHTGWYIVIIQMTVNLLQRETVTEPTITCIIHINPLVIAATKALGILIDPGALILVPGSVFWVLIQKGVGYADLTHRAATVALVKYSLINIKCSCSTMHTN